MLDVVVLVSGGGTNLQAIIDAVESESITNTRIVGVISNNKNAYALTRAKQHGIHSECISPKDYASREEAYADLRKLREEIDETKIDVFRANVDKFLTENPDGTVTYLAKTKSIVLWWKPEIED